MSDDGAARAFATFHRALVAETPANGARVVRFFDRKEFYSAHGEDADYVARTFYRVREGDAFGGVVWGRSRAMGDVGMRARRAGVARALGDGWWEI